MQRRHFLYSLPSLSIAGAPALFMSAASAHHGWSSFDDAKPIYLTGTVKALRWQNPHAEVIITMPADATLPADLAGRVPPAQSQNIPGARILASATLPQRRGEWTLELSPMSRIEAWKVPEPRLGSTISAVGYTFKDEKGAALARVEYLIIGQQLFGLRSLPV